MDGGMPPGRVFRFDPAAADVLMPMHLGLQPDGRIVSAGPTLRRLFAGLPLLGQRFHSLFHIRRPYGLEDMGRLIAAAGQRLYLSSRDGRLAHLRGVATPLIPSAEDGGGLVINLSFGAGILDAVRDHGLTDADFAPTELAMELLYVVEAKTAVMEELRALNHRLHGAKTEAEERALTDTLTGLRNRRGLDQALVRLPRRGGPFGLMHIDLDFFKQVNDTLGHAAGDHVLREVARILCDEVRSGDTVARVGGDEFVVVLPRMGDAARLQQIASRIIRHLNAPILFEGQACHVSASIGMTLSSFYPRPDPQRMIEDADAALYASKRAGRGQAVMHSPLADPSDLQAG